MKKFYYKVTDPIFDAFDSFIDWGLKTEGHQMIITIISSLVGVLLAHWFFKLFPTK